MKVARQVLAVKDFRRLLVGQAVSGLGDWMLTFTLMALIWEEYSSASAVAVILALRLLPAALGGGIAARIAKHWDRRKTMLVMDYVRVVLVAIIPLTLELWWLYLWAFVLEACGIVFLSARDASIPDLSAPENLTTANGMMLGSSFGSIPIGAGLFALLSRLPFAEGSWFAENFAVIFWIDALTYLVSALMIARMPPLGRPVGHDPDAPAGRMRDALRIPLVRSVIWVTCAVALGLGALFPLGIALVREELEANTQQFGLLVMMFGIGAGLGLFAVTKLKLSLLTMTRAGVLLMGALVAGMSLSSHLWLTLIGAVGFGAGATTALSAGMSALQTSTAEHERQMAFAVFHMLIRSGLGLAAVLAGIVGDLLEEVAMGSWRLSGTRFVLLVSGILVVGSAATVKTQKVAPNLRPVPKREDEAGGAAEGGAEGGDAEGGGAGGGAEEGAGGDAGAEAGGGGGPEGAGGGDAEGSASSSGGSGG